MVPGPEIVKPSTPSAFTKAAKYLMLCPLHARVEQAEMADAVAAFQLAALAYLKVSALLEEERTAHKGAARHHDDAPTLAGGMVDNGLYGLGLHERAVVGTHAIVGNNVLFTQLVHVNACRIAEPRRNGRPVGEQGRLLFLLTLAICRHGQHDKQCHEQSFSHQISLLIYQMHLFLSNAKVGK